MAGERPGVRRAGFALCLLAGCASIQGEASAAGEENPGACAVEGCSSGLSCGYIQTTRDNPDDFAQCIVYNAPGDWCANVDPGLCPTYSRWAAPYDSVTAICTYFMPDSNTVCSDGSGQDGTECMQINDSTNSSRVNVVYGCIEFNGTDVLFEEGSLNWQLARGLRVADAVNSGCASPDSERLCFDHGTCAPQESESMVYECMCNPGYGGTYCQLVESNECTTEAQCAAGACNVTAGQCECTEGTTGNQCAYCDPTFSSSCDGHGTCVTSSSSGSGSTSNGSCECYDGYYGEHCTHQTSLTTTVAEGSGSMSESIGDSSSTASSASSSGSTAVPPTKNSARVGTIVGIGAAALVVVAAALLWWHWCRRRQASAANMWSYLGMDHELATTDDITSNNRGQEPGARSDTRSVPTQGMPGGSSSLKPGTNLWRDPVIVSSRIARKQVVLGHIISRGGFGEVYRGTFNEQLVAVKMLLPENRRDLKQIDAFLTEAKLVATLNHTCIVRLVGVAWNSLVDLCIVSEFMLGGDLRSLLAGFQTASQPTGFNWDKLRIACDVANALTYLHSLSPAVIHRDLKSRNVLLTADGSEAKLTDFGVSRERAEATMTAGVGTSLWMAPEVMIGERYNEKADVFSFGAVLSELDTHTLPYAAAGLPQARVVQMVAMGKLQLTFSANPSSEEAVAIAELGKACVSFDPSQRPTAAVAHYTLHSILRRMPAST